MGIYIKANKIQLAVLACMAALAPIAGYTQNYRTGDVVHVSALSGLTLREAPGVESAKITLLSYGEKVVVQTPASKAPVKINGFSGNWIQVEAAGKSGFVFDAYLTRLPLFSIDSSNSKKSRAADVLDKYIREKIGIADSIIYTNGLEEEGFQQWATFQLKGEHVYARKSAWKHLEYGLQFAHISENEFISWVKAFLKKCGQLSKTNEQNLTPAKYRTSRFTLTGEPCSIFLGKHEDHYSISIDCRPQP